MKKIILLLVTLFSLNAVTYASFPVTNGPAEQLSALNEIPPVSADGPGWGIAALCCGILGIAFPPLGILAIVFGAIGMKNSGRGMAIAGLVLGIIEVLFMLVYVLLLLAFISGGGGYGL